MLDPELRRALAHLAPYRRSLALVAVLSLASTLASIYLPYLTRELVDGALLGRDSRALARVALAFAAATVVGFGLNVASGMRYTRVSAEVLFEMRLELYRHLQRLSPRFYARTRLGEIVSRLNNDIAEIQRIAAETALAWVGNVLFLAGTVAMLLWLDARLFFLAILFLPPSLVALVRYRRLLTSRAAALRQASADIGSFLIETLQGMKLVVAARAEEREVERFRGRNAAFLRAVESMQLAGYLAGGLPGLVLSCSTLAVFLYGGSRVIDHTLTVGTFAAFLAYQMRLFPPIQALMGLWSNLGTVRVSLRRVHELLETPPEVAERPGALPLGTVRGEIRFEGVTVLHDRGLPALERVSFEANAGEVVAIVGQSGSGKSTIGDLMLRFLDPDEGTVRIDGLDLRDVRISDLRRRVALVEQEPPVFHASIAENVRYARPEASDAEVEHAARAAGLHEFVAMLPDRYDTVVGERGRALSAGERQRIAIARAFLADPAILVLDEATSALDPSAERQVVESYQGLQKGRTTLVISHRRELAARADRVVVLEGARVVERGTPRELERSRGAYAALFSHAS